MNITIIGSAHPLRGGGIATFNERLAEVLQSQGEKVNIYSFSLQYPSFLFPGKSQFTDEPAPVGLTIKSVINSVNPLNWLKVGKKLRDERPDLIIVRYWIPFMGPCLGTILRLVRKNNHTRILCIVDNLIPHEQRPGDKQFTNYFMKPVHAFVTMSKAVLRDVQALTSKPSRFSPHPVYDTYGDPVSKAEACARLKLDPSQKYMLFFGFIRDYKGLDLLLHAMCDERMKKAKIHLLVAGEYYDKNAAAANNKIIEDNGLKELVHLHTDFIPNNEVSLYFGASDVVVQPYKHATVSGITQVAYQFEKPMIVTNVGGLPEVVPDGKVGFVTSPEPEAIATAILRFFEPGSIPHLQENLLEEKKKYSWETFIKALKDTAFMKDK